MILTRHQTADGPRWALDGALLPPQLSLRSFLEQPRAALPSYLAGLPRGAAAGGDLLAPVEAAQEVWAAGVTYLRSRQAREAESTVKALYSKVYDAERPELFFKAAGWRVVGPGGPIRIRADSRWNVPEPELALVINAHGEIVGYCAGNDVSSRDIEGENPLYLPQAKVYRGSCALGQGIMLAEPARMKDLPIQLTVTRGGRAVFQGETRTTQMKRSLEELAGYLGKELDFPGGVFLLTGTGIVPAPDFSMDHGDVVRITVGELTLENQVE
jgi:2-dehydro-3-deoxy-D-arabinonate dehydratase